VLWLMLPSGSPSVVTSAERATGGRISLSGVAKLKASLPPAKKKSAADLLRLCHRHLHGDACKIQGCVAAAERLQEQHRLSFSNLLSSAPVRDPLKGRTAAAEAARQSAAISFDFVAPWFKLVRTEVDAASDLDSADDAFESRTSSLRDEARATIEWLDGDAEGAANAKGAAQLEASAGAPLPASAPQQPP